MPKIERLPAALASQIAAGEVVERPASALKELLENSLDAGASRCDIEINGGGIDRLRLRDDGYGMSPEDALLCVERHATSKLRTFEELADIPSFGFRGEALPSIASVSRFTLQTRDPDHDAGTQVVVNGGSAPVVSEMGMPVGTVVEMSELFFNVPARRKFLRSSGTEAGHVTEVVDNAALSCPEITFTLTRDGKKAREWLRAQDRASRVAAVFNLEELAPCRGERGPLTLEAYLGRPERARAGASGLRLFVNQRPVRDRALLHTIVQAYGSVLERGRYPRGVVYINLPPRLVDINVHPQKSEVRFADSRAVTDAAYQILTEQLSQAFSLPTESRGRWETKDSRAPSRSGGQLPGAGRPQYRPGALLGGRDAAPAGVNTRGAAPPWAVPRSDAAPSETARALADGPPSSQPSGAATPAPEPAINAEAALAPSSRPTQASFFSDREPELSGTSPASADAEPGTTWKKLRFLAQVRSTYLVCEGLGGLYVLDQHAAAERVTFDRLRKQYGTHATASQSLLFPLTLEVGAEQCELVEAHEQDIQNMGFDISALDETHVTVRTVPKLLQRGSPERLARDLLSELARSGRGFSDAVDAALSTIACHGSIRAGEVLDSKEASALLEALDSVDFSGHCPHGRPIVTFTPWSELERKVGRR